MYETCRPGRDGAGRRFSPAPSVLRRCGPAAGNTRGGLPNPLQSHPGLKSRGWEASQPSTACLRRCGPAGAAPASKSHPGLKSRGWEASQPSTACLRRCGPARETLVADCRICCCPNKLGSPRCRAEAAAESQTCLGLPHWNTKWPNKLGTPLASKRSRWTTVQRRTVVRLEPLLYTIDHPQRNLRLTILTKVHIMR